MAPTLLHRDTVLVDLNRTALREGRIYAIAVGDALQIKRLQLMAGERIRIISDNPSYHTYDVHADEIRIIGQMIWFCRALV
jgi:phage repressor protein C with HTH and peptisase S24 domain